MNFTREDIDFDKLHTALSSANKTPKLYGRRMTVLCCILHHVKGTLHCSKMLASTLGELGLYDRSWYDESGVPLLINMNLEIQEKIACIGLWDYDARKRLSLWEDFKKEPIVEAVAQ